jgi:hypothetical protein
MTRNNSKETVDWRSTVLVLGGRWVEKFRSKKPNSRETRENKSNWSAEELAGMREVFFAP